MSLDILNKLIAIKAMKIEDGSISIFDRGMVILPSEMLVRLQELMQKRLGKEEADKIMFDAGDYQTRTGSVRYLEKKKDLAFLFNRVSATGDPAIEMGREVLKLTGMGDIQIREITKEKGKIMLATRNSPIALEYLRTRGKSETPVCHYVKGVISGVLHTVYLDEYEGIETVCQATGRSHECVFEFRKKNHSV